MFEFRVLSLDSYLFCFWQINNVYIDIYMSTWLSFQSSSFVLGVPQALTLAQNHFGQNMGRTCA